MSECQIIVIYNQGISQFIGVIKELSNEIKTLNSQAETLSKDNKAINEHDLRITKVNQKSQKLSGAPFKEVYYLFLVYINLILTPYFQIHKIFEGSVFFIT